MAVFRNTEHLYEVLDAFFKRVAERPEVAESLLAGALVIRFRYSEPEGQITVDLRQGPVSWQTGESELEPDVEMIQSADTAHQFWLGRLNVPTAIATRKVVSRGPVAKALKLLPAVKPAFALYQQTLRELGYEAMLPAEKPTSQSLAKGWDRFVRLFGRLRKKELPDTTELNAHLIPLSEEAELPPVSFRDQQLPTDEAALKVEMLRRMMLIRAFEQYLSEANKQGQIPTEAIHLSIGQEATAVGVCFALRPDDYIATTHRGHGHMLAKGVELDGMMAELLAKATGLCDGKGGSMHVTDATLGAIGANGIVGASPLIATGAAHAARLRKSDQVAVAFFGDGATNQGMFHEALNFAAVFDLPAVFVVENNLYGEFTPIGRHTRVKQLADRAAAYGMPGQTVDGNDPWAVYEAMQQAVQRARRGEGPTLLECLTYRWHGHMEGETADYRSDEEIAEWKAKCPIKLWRQSLVAQDLLSADDAEQLQQQARDAVQLSFEKAQQDPEPERKQLFTDVYCPDPADLYRPKANASNRVDGPEITNSQAIADAIAEEMERDDRVYLLGEDVTTGGYFAVTAGLVDRFGAARIVDTPISEYAIVGSAVGAAMTGARPVAEILVSDFLTTCADPIVNQAAKLRYMSGGQYSVPMVVRSPGGAGLGMAAQHSQCLEALFTGIPGLIVLAPGTPYDAKGLLKAAIRSNNPVLFFENKVHYTATGPVPQDEYLVPIGVADIKRAGTDLTLVSIGVALANALEAAQQLAANGVEVEVVDVRSLVPLDLATIVRSVAKTGRLVTVEDAALCHGFGSEVVARVAEVAFSHLKAAPRRVAGADVPIPYNTALENAAVPDVEAIRKAAEACLGR